MKVLLTQLRRRSADARENFRGVVKVIERSRLSVSRDDILLLPELIGGELARPEYERLTSELGRAIGCHVVSGTNHHTRRGKTINSGVVSDPQGRIVTSYDKLRPYSIEGAASGTAVGQFEIRGCRILVLVCADFWYSDVFLGHIAPRPDLILVPTFSISRRSSPRVARSLWRSMAIARAYEFSVYVGISDWAHPCEYHGLRSSSVAGLANARPTNGNGFFTSMGERSLMAFAIDLPRLRELRQHRSQHAFLSDEALSALIYKRPN
jgi:predicted amidohydrolase